MNSSICIPTFKIFFYCSIRSTVGVLCNFKIGFVGGKILKISEKYKRSLYKENVYVMKILNLFSILPRCYYLFDSKSSC